VHEGWGAEVVRWGSGRRAAVAVADGGGGGAGENGEVVVDGDIKGGGGNGNGRNGQQQQQHGSKVLADLGSLWPLKGDSVEVVNQKKARLGEYQRGKCIMTGHCVGDTLPVEKGVNTLFVNAAVMGEPVRPAWVVDIELPVAGKGVVGSAKDL
jgi:hypothetical protein